ncbi:MAG TPA: exodeoxyribonuclease III [Polyangiaceae bacterium]
MKIISWNVNGLRSVLRVGALDAVLAEKPDVVCLQEVKCQADEVCDALPRQYHVHVNSADRKGYAGTAILSRRAPLRVTPHIGVAAHDSEGRVQTAEYDDFYLVNVYVPNSKRDLSRLPYRQIWDRDFLKYLKRLERKKPVVFCGDLNVAHTELDLTHPKTNRKNHGFTDEERAGFDAFIRAGFVDSFREFQKAGGHYTWWSVFAGARARNVGWRIDYVLISHSLRPRLKKAFIRSEVLGSDHCPVGIELK